MNAVERPNRRSFYFAISRKEALLTKPLRIITQSFELITEVDGYSSLHFTRKFHGIDELELTVNRHMRGANELLRGRIIVVGSALNKAFIIRSREIALDENGKQSENWKITARGLKSALNLRLALPPPGFSQDGVKTNAESVMKHYVTANAITTSSGRINPYLTVAPNLNRGDVIEWQSRYKQLDEELTEISELTDVGWNIALDYANKRWIFDVALGRNLTATQSVNPPVIFAPQFDSLKTLEYTNSDLNYRSVAYVAGAGEGADRRIVVVGDATGMDRYELFVDARDIQETVDVDGVETPIPEAEVIASLTERGLQKLAEYAQEEYLSAQILTQSPFIYERDYDLGDIVTVKNDDWGIGMDARITEITEIYEAGSPVQIEATFGIGRPTFIGLIKKEFSDLRVMTKYGIKGTGEAMNVPSTQVRYIRDWSAGSNVDTAVIWSEIQAFDTNGINVALNKNRTYSQGYNVFDPEQINDGLYELILDNGGAIHDTDGNTQLYAQIDLGSIISLNKIKVWHYPDGRTFKKTKLEVSMDGVNWTVLFDSAISGTYAETAAGKTHVM